MNVSAVNGVRAVVSSILVLFGTGCGLSGPLAVSGAGASFDLVTFDGAEVPAETEYGFRALSGRLVLAPDQTCERRIELRYPTAQEQVVVTQCTWSDRSDGFELRWSPTGTDPIGTAMGTSSAVLENGRLTLVINTGIVCVTTPCPSGWVEEYLLDR